MKIKGLYVLNADAFEKIYPLPLRRQIESLVEINSLVLTAEHLKNHPEVLKGVRFLFSGWGCPLLDAAFLKNAAEFEIVFYGAGSVKGLLSDAFWEKGVALPLRRRPMLFRWHNIFCRRLYFVLNQVGCMSIFCRKNMIGDILMFSGYIMAARLVFCRLV